MSRNDLNQLLADLRRSGFTVRRANSGHWHVRTRDGRLIASMPSTPSDPRSVANTRADVARRIKALRGGRP